MTENAPNGPDILPLGAPGVQLRIETAALVATAAVYLHFSQ